MTPEVNVPLLRAVLECATRNPHKHNQESYGYRKPGCGTAYCIAGMTLVMSRVRLAWDEESGESEAAETADYCDVGTLAGQLLGLPVNYKRWQLDDCKGRHLFHTTNSLRECWEIASELTDGEITVPDDVPEVEL